MGTYPSVDASFARLHAAGWSVGDVRLLTAAGAAWLVTGSNGENGISARGATEAEAWGRACQQAAALGMLRRTPRTDLKLGGVGTLGFLREAQ